MDERLIARFESRVLRSKGCWEWNGAHNGVGYSETWNGIRPVLAHRVAYEIYKGPIPAGLTLDHLCRNPGCVNPGHLEAVTHRENMLRGNTIGARNAAKTHCIRGHPFDVENTYINKTGQRVCRACWKVRWAARSEKQRRIRL